MQAVAPASAVRRAAAALPLLVQRVTAGDRPSRCRFLHECGIRGYSCAMSWRDETPPQVQEDLDRLVDEALRAAQHFLEKNGEFYPFALSLDDDGTGQLSGADPGEGEHPPSESVLT